MMTNLRKPIFLIVNRKYLQLGIFADNLSIDEEMVYFGCYSCKLFIHSDTGTCLILCLVMEKQKNQTIWFRFPSSLKAFISGRLSRSTFFWQFLYFLFPFWKIKKKDLALLEQWRKVAVPNVPCKTDNPYPKRQEDRILVHLN